LPAIVERKRDRVDVGEPARQAGDVERGRAELLLPQRETSITGDDDGSELPAPR